jgi:hypothetical protein
MKFIRQVSKGSICFLSELILFKKLYDGKISIGNSGLLFGEYSATWSSILA